MKEQRSSTVELRFLAEPKDVNFGGKVHGGTVMKWIDQAGYSCASVWSGLYCVTVYVGGIRFFKPIQIGHMVEAKAQLIYTGRTSMHIMIDIYSGDLKTPEKQKTTSCIVIFVAVDENGQPTPVEQWKPQTEEEQQLELYAKDLMERRKEIFEAKEKFLGES